MIRALIFTGLAAAGAVGAAGAMQQAHKLAAIMQDLRPFTTNAGLRAPDADARLNEIRQRLDSIARVGNAQMQEISGCPQGLPASDLRCTK